MTCLIQLIDCKLIFNNFNMELNSARLVERCYLFYLRSLDQTLASTIGTCKLATSRYLPSLAEATMTMYARSALLLGDVFPDGWTLRLGDEAEGLTPGVAAKREELPLPIRATQGEQDPKAVSDDHVDLLKKNHRSRTGLDLAHCWAI